MWVVDYLCTEGELLSLRSGLITFDSPGDLTRSAIGVLNIVTDILG